MYKVVMRDLLGWMKEEILLTSHIDELMQFIQTYGACMTLSELSNMKENEVKVICTADGLKLSVWSN